MPSQHRMLFYSCPILLALVPDLGNVAEKRKMWFVVDGKVPGKGAAVLLTQREANTSRSVHRVTAHKRLKVQLGESNKDATATLENCVNGQR